MVELGGLVEGPPGLTMSFRMLFKRCMMPGLFALLPARSVRFRLVPVGDVAPVAEAGVTSGDGLDEGAFCRGDRDDA